MFYREDGNEEREAPVVVTRAVYDVAVKLDAQVKASRTGPAFETAREKAAQCLAAGDRDGAALWNDVFNYLMTVESVGADTETVILEKGESYDFEKSEIIRPVP